MSNDCSGGELRRASRARVSANLYPVNLIRYLMGAFHKRSRLA